MCAWGCVTCTIWDQDCGTCGQLDPSSGPFWPLLGPKNNTSKIIEIHCKKPGFGNMRLPNGAKMEPKCALFLSVKIIRIHCKKRGLGSHGPILKMHQNQDVLFFVQKTDFSQPTISPRQEPHFLGLRTHFFTFFEVFFG